MPGIAPHEVTLTCPYDPAHQILPHRMSLHLIKCGKQHPNTKLVTCSFDTTHRIKKEDLEAHHAACPGRKVAEVSVFKSTELFYKAPPIKAKQDLTLPKGFQGEDWENEATVVKSYDAMAKCQKTATLTELKGGTRRERKAYRADENRRLSELHEAAAAAASSSSSRPAGGPTPSRGRF